MTDSAIATDLSDAELIAELVERIAARVEEEREYLTELDSKIGDADFGANLDRGLDAVSDELAEMDLEAAGAPAVVQTVGETLIDEMAGSSGILFGGGLLTAADELEDGVTLEAASEFAQAYADHIEERGDVALGAKTMFDAVVPTAFLLKKAVADEDDPAAATARAAAAAERGAAFTSTLQAKKGRASYVETRSIGHPDPGAVFTAMVLEEVHGLVEDVTGESVDVAIDDSL